MINFRQRLAAHRQRLVAQGTTLRGDLAADMASLRQRVTTGTRILSLLPLAKPLFAFWWRRRRR